MRLANNHWCWNASALDIPQTKAIQDRSRQMARSRLSESASWKEEIKLNLEHEKKLQNLKLESDFDPGFEWIWTRSRAWRLIYRYFMDGHQMCKVQVKQKCPRFWDSVIPGVSRFLAHGAAVGGSMDMKIIDYLNFIVKRSPCWYHAHDKLQQHLPHRCSLSWHHATSTNYWDILSPSQHQSRGYILCFIQHWLTSVSNFSICKLTGWRTSFPPIVWRTLKIRAVGLGKEGLSKLIQYWETGKIFIWIKRRITWNVHRQHHTCTLRTRHVNGQ